MRDIFDPIETTTLAALGVKGGSKKAVVMLCEQQSMEWFSLRLGIPSASRYDEIITPAGAIREGQTPQSYMNALIGERITGAMTSQRETLAMARGNELEPRARAWYEFTTGRKVKQVGFVYRDKSKQTGCSPDGLCEDRGLEIKCPEAKMLVGLLRMQEGEKSAAAREYQRYWMQCQAGMWNTGLKLWDLCLFTPEPELANKIVKIPADPKMQAAFDVAIPAFCAELNAAEKMLRGMVNKED